MGKLAERLSDAQRSGVYRVETTEALEEAAALNGFSLARFPFGDGIALPGKAARDGQVLLFSGFEDLVRKAPGALDALLSELHAAAAGARQARQRFFAAFLDPERMLSLSPLYNWEPAPPPG